MKKSIRVVDAVRSETGDNDALTRAVIIKAVRSRERERTKMTWRRQVKEQNRIESLCKS